MAVRRVVADREGPLGVLDSGIGGLAVLRALRTCLPGEDLLYLGDTAGFPYGERPQAWIRRRVVAGARWLAARGAKTIVLACNTAAAVAVPALRRDVGLPVVGVIAPEARAAARASRSGRIGILATEATVRSGEYARALARVAPAAELVAVPCPGLAAAIQEQGASSPAVAAIVRRMTVPLARGRVDTVVLGCTHYAAVGGLVGRCLPGVALVGPGTELCADVAAALDWHGLRRTGGAAGRAWLACTGDTGEFAAAAARTLGEAPGPVAAARLAGVAARVAPPAGWR